MAVVYPTYPVTTLAQAEDMIVFTSNQIHDVMNADATSVIEAEDGAIPSIRKALVDNMYFKTPQYWVASTQVTDPLQLKQFTDGGWYFAPTATVSTPVNLGITPIGDTQWKSWSKGQAATYQHAKRLAAEAGYNMVSGSFYFGGSLDSTDDVLFYEGDGKVYGWGGTLPKTVNGFLNATPETTGGIGAGAWVDRSGSTIRDELSAPLGVKLVENSNLYASTIANLLQLNLQEGDVVSIGCFHNIFDNAHHTRYISSANDGAGVQLVNGLWANIKHNGTVDFSWSGALPSDADVSVKLQTFIETYACKAEIVISSFYTLTNKVRLKQGTVIRGTTPLKGINVGGLGPTATPPAQRNGFLLKGINGWAFDTSIWKLIGGSYVRQDDLIGKAGEQYDSANYIAVNNNHFRDLSFISGDYISEASNIDIEAFGAINLNGSNGSTVKGCYIFGTVCGVCVAGSWGHEVSGNLIRCKLAEYISYYNSWTKASNNYCTNCDIGLDLTAWFTKYASKLPTEMLLPRGYADTTECIFGRTKTNMISIESSTTFEDNFTERAVLGYGIQDVSTHWVPTIRGARGELHTVMFAVKTTSAIKMGFEFVAGVSYLVELIQQGNCVAELRGTVNRSTDAYTSVFNTLQSTYGLPCISVYGVDYDLIGSGWRNLISFFEPINGPSSVNINSMSFINSPAESNCGIAPITVENNVPLRTSQAAGCVPIQVTVGAYTCYGLEVFAGSTINANGKTGTMRMFFYHPTNQFYIQGFGADGAVKSSVITLS